MRSECVDYRELPGQNSLFLSYLHDFDKVRNFYTSPPLISDGLEERVSKVLKTRRFPRQQLLPSLREFNQKVCAGEEALENIEKLGSSDTLAVVTGQQVGLFGGPSFSVYKAATAVWIARYLVEKGYPAVPVFWLASDDSDFAEVRSTYFVESTGELLNVRCPDRRVSGSQMVGTISTDKLVDLLPEAGSRGYRAQNQGDTLELLFRSYGRDVDFRQAFALWLAGLFHQYGLIVFDPLMPGYRRYLDDFIGVVLENREALVRSLFQRSEALKAAGFPVQIRVEETETCLFWVEGRSRYKLEFQNGSYRAKGRRSIQLSEADLARTLENDAGQLGVNVLLRPILQDYLFPTFVSVTGPAEIAYLSQVNILSALWDLELATFPRAACTLVDRKSQRLLKKYGLTAKEVLTRSPFEQAERILRSEQATGVLEELDALRSTLSEGLGRVGSKIEEEDPTVAGMLQGTTRKIFYQLDKVSRRFVTNYQTHRHHMQRHLAHLSNHLTPRRRLQERVLNFNHFLMEEGLGLVDELVESLNPLSLSHQLLYL
jgi:bacillithiol biosynthesis cysteine-adding enzyme BshC